MKSLKPISVTLLAIGCASAFSPSVWAQSRSDWSIYQPLPLEQQAVIDKPSPDPIVTGEQTSFTTVIEPGSLEPGAMASATIWPSWEAEDTNEPITASRYTAVIEPGSLGSGTMAEEIDSPAWHADEIIGPIEAERLEKVYFEFAPQGGRSGWTAALDVLILAPGGDFYGDNDERVGVGSRFTLQQESESGSGRQIRLSHVDFSSVRYDRKINFERQDLAFDFTQRMRIGRSAVTFGLGPRVSRQQYQSKSTSRYYYSNNDHQMLAGGFGISVAFERLLYETEQSKFSFVGYARQAWLAGAVTDSNDSTGFIAQSVSELASGIEWRRRWGRGNLVMQGVFEVQEADPLYSSTVHVGSTTHGGAFRIGYQW